MTINTDQMRQLVFVGSYAEASASGVYVYSLDADSGALTLLNQVSGLQNPTFLNLDVTNQRLYAIAERLTDGQRMGAAVAFSIDPTKGTLQELNRSATVDATTCHIQRDKDNQFLVVSSYSGGKLGLLSLAGDGQVGELLDAKQHEGHSVDPDNQNKPHVHFAVFSPDNRFVLAADLGIDRIRTYKVDGAQRKLVSQSDAVLQPGAGPRHLAFHPNEEHLYVINELNSTITLFHYDRGTGELTTQATVSTLPEDYNGENACAEIQLSSDGRFLYGSNRGHDSLVVFAIDPDTGNLAYVEHVSTQGEHPRHFSLTPDGQFLLAANRDTNNIATFRVDTQSGKLQYTGQQVQTSKPVCVKIGLFPVH
ncbi:lactonase family protein [Paenibacillus eucommiae]|uniref:6-phosphogluconolactonase n=1 Tax=Paenibacillus eucommiae TaxID=1355755 RepID=A0ABS4J2G2_9BACL|nr:lactonase family protein [Paenibacillus eucommiae]MBP1994008.1 6-phosphogluconolactonase [Paenibacillus eucommiae]